MNGERIILCAESAIDYWRTTAGASIVVPDAIVADDLPHVRPSSRNARALEVAANLGLNLPLHVAVSTQNAKQNSTALVCHIWKESLEGRLTQLGNNVWVVDAATALVQVAPKLGFVQLLLLVLELVGNYALAPGTKDGFVFRKTPLCTVKEITKAVSDFKGKCVPGCKKVLDVLKYAVEESRSPAESRVFVFYSLARRRGGLGLPGILLNHKIRLSAKARLILDLKEIKPDLYHPASRSALEYNSKMWHPEETRTRDEKRADALRAMGLYVVNLDDKRVKDFKDLCGVGYIISQRAGIRRTKPTAEMLSRRRKLHRELFLPNQVDDPQPADELPPVDVYEA